MTEGLGGNTVCINKREKKRGDKEREKERREKKYKPELLRACDFRKGKKYYSSVPNPEWDL